jgi:hypothetical protein
MAELMEDQEPIMNGPPFNPVIDLSTLSHDEFVSRARQVITTGNPQGHPPGMLSPTMQSLNDGLEVTRESYASVTNPMRNKSPPSMRTNSPTSESSYNGSVLTEDRESINDYNLSTVVESIQPTTKEKTATKKAAKIMRVKLAPLEMTAVKRVKTRRTTHAIAMLQDQSSAPRSLGARQIKVTERLGDYTKGKKQIASSAVALSSSIKVPIPSSSQPTVIINLNRTIEDNSSDGEASVILPSPENNKGDKNKCDLPLINSVNRKEFGRATPPCSNDQLRRRTYPTLLRTTARKMVFFLL